MRDLERALNTGSRIDEVLENHKINLDHKDINIRNGFKGSIDYIRRIGIDIPEEREDNIIYFDIDYTNRILHSIWALNRNESRDIINRLWKIEDFYNRDLIRKGKKFGKELNQEAFVIYFMQIGGHLNLKSKTTIMESRENLLRALKYKEYYRNWINLVERCPSLVDVQQAIRN